MTVFILPYVQFAVASDTEYTFTGIFGLGYASSASIGHPPILDWLIHEQLIYAKIFSIGLGSHGDEFCKFCGQSWGNKSTDMKQAKSSSAV